MPAISTSENKTMSYKFPKLPAVDYSDRAGEDDIAASLPAAPAGMRWRVAIEDRHAKQFYDFAGAVRTARRGGWSCEGMPAGVSPGERAALAARQDYEYLRAWCEDDWRYVGIVVWLETEDGGDVEGADEYSFALWRIESFAVDCLSETARELAADILAALAETAQRQTYPVTECGV
jgi:hypothetical protein